MSDPTSEQFYIVDSGMVGACAWRDSYVQKLRTQLDEMTKERDIFRHKKTLLIDCVQAFLDNIDEPPSPNCSCHIAPPCQDCVEYSGLRETFVQARKLIDEEKDVGL